MCTRGANGVCTRASRIASLSTRGYGRKRRAKDEGAERGSARIAVARGRERQSELESEGETEGKQRGRSESKQNLHGNSVPVGRVELRVFNAVHFVPSPFDPLSPHRHPSLLLNVLILHFSLFLSLPLPPLSVFLRLAVCLFLFARSCLVLPSMLPFNLSLSLPLAPPSPPLVLSLSFAIFSRFNVAARKLLFLTGSIILPRPTR